MHTLVLIVLMAVFAIHLWYTATGNAGGRRWTKPLLMPLLLAFYVLEAESPNTAVIVSLLCGALGDVFLLWPQRQGFFIAGLLSFLVGHILYVSVFLRDAGVAGGIPVWFYAALIPYLIYGVIFYLRLRPYLGQMKLAFLLYIVVIFAMSLSSLLRVRNIAGLGFYLCYLGSLLFIVSDSILAVDTFKANIRYGDVYIMTAYLLGQACIVMGLLQA